MTERTNSNPPTDIEKATADVVYDISVAISRAYTTHHLTIGEPQFRRIIAGYFDNRSFTDWCHDLGIQPREGDPQ
jgi:hypothetical protein